MPDIASPMMGTDNRRIDESLLRFGTAMNIIKSAKRLTGFAIGQIPFGVQKQIFERVVQQVFKDALAQGDLEFLEGKKLKISLLDMQASWITGLYSGRIVLHPAELDYDAHISGNLDEFLLLASGEEDPDTLFFQRRLNIEGSTEISLAVKNVMDSIGPLSLPAPVKYMLLRLIKISQRYSGDTS